MNKQVIELFRHPLVLCVVIFTVALAMRLCYLALSIELNLFPDLFLDSKYYQRIAVLIAQGFGAGDHPYQLSPLYPYILAPFINEEGVLDAYNVRYLQAVTGSITCVLIADSSRRILNSYAGWIAGFIAALYGPAIHYDALILVASLQSFLIVLTVWLLLQVDIKQPSFVKMLVVGVVISLSSALRPTTLLIILACAAFLILAYIKTKDNQLIKKMLVPFCIGAVLVITPFTIRNYMVSQEFITLSGYGGFNFWIGNHKGSHGVPNYPKDYNLVFDPIGKEIASKQTGKQLSYRESSEWWKQRAINDIENDPARWVTLLFKKALLFAHRNEIPHTGLNFQWYQQKAGLLQLMPINGMHLLILSLLAPVLLWMNHKERFIKLFWPLFFIVVYWSGLTMFFVTGRYRAPIMPSAIILSAVALVLFFQMLFKLEKNLSHVLLPAAFFVGFSFAGEALYKSKFLLPVNSLYSGVEERQQGMALYKAGRYKEAEHAYRRSLAIRENPITRGNLANALKAQGNIDAAFTEYQKVLRVNPRDAVVLYNLANLYRDYKQNPVEAIALYQQAVEIRPQFFQAHLNLGLLHGRLGQNEQAKQSLQAYLTHAPQNDPNREGVVRAIIELGIQR